MGAYHKPRGEANYSVNTLINFTTIVLPFRLLHKPESGLRMVQLRDGIVSNEHVEFLGNFIWFAQGTELKIEFFQYDTFHDLGKTGVLHISYCAVNVL